MTAHSKALPEFVVRVLLGKTMTSDQRMKSESITRHQRLHTKESRVAMKGKNFGVLENLDTGGGISNSMSGLMGV